MKFYGADMKGVTNLEKLSSDPSPYVGSRDDGRMYFQTTQQAVKVGGSGAFQTLDIPSGTVMLFGQSSAPAGWTKKTDWQDNSMLVYTTGAAGNGGSADAKTFNPSVGNAGAHTHNVASHTHTTGDHVLSIGGMPAHVHGLGFNFHATSGDSEGLSGRATTEGAPDNTFSEGDGNPHNHGATGGSVSTTDDPGNHTHSYNNYTPYYQTIIAATKD